MPRRSARSRSFTYNIRLNEAEHAKAKELAFACRTSIAHVLRTHLAGHPRLKAVDPPVPAFDQQAVREIRRIGVNLNQLTRELYRNERQTVTIKEIHAVDVQLMRLVAFVYTGRDGAQQLWMERFSQWFAGVRLPREPNQDPRGSSVKITGTPPPSPGPNGRKPPI